MNKLLTIGTAGLLGGLLCRSAIASTAITDTTGYVVLSATDAWQENSFINGKHFPGGAPVAGKDYLVNSQRMIRTPESGSPFVFQGDSLTLDGEATLLLKCPSSKTTINDLRIYNATISQGDANCAKELRGNMTVFGTPASPSMLSGSGAGGDRIIDLNSKVCGASGTCLQVRHSADADKDGCEFFVRVASDNSDSFLGTFEVMGDNANVVVADMKVLGSSCSVTLRDGGGLLGQGSNGLTVNGRTITVDNGGRLGSFEKNGTAITIGGGSTISGTGTLLIHNAKRGSTWKGPIVMNNVAVSGLGGIAIANNATLAVGAGYSGAAVPVAVKSGGTLRVDGAAQTGSVTLDNGAALTFALASGTLAVNGTITTTAADGKIRIDLNDQSVSSLSATNAWRILSATNLGTAGATAADFAITADAAADLLRDTLTNGTLSIETDGGVSYLLYTLPHKIVYTQGTDGAGSGDNGSSFQTGKRWSDKALPHSDADYFVFNGASVRALDGSTATFNGHSLSVLSGGQFLVQGATVTVNDMRLYGGSRLSATRTAGNILEGNIAICGSATDPVVFQIEVNKGPNEPYRAIQLRSKISGSGSVRCIYAPGHVNDNYTPSVNYPGKFDIRGDNTGFTGEWLLSHFAIQGTFKSAANIGSASAVVLCSNAVFRAEAASFETPAATRFVVNNNGSVAGSEEKTNGGTFLVDAGQTLTVNGVVSGAGILRKTGAGTLRLMAQNTLDGNLIVKAGNIGGTGKVNKIELADGAGFDVSATQATPFEVGSLIVDGAIALHIRDAANADLSRIAVAKVGTLTGTLASAKATVDGGRGGTYRLSISNGILYAAKPGFVLVVR